MQPTWLLNHRRSLALPLFRESHMRTPIADVMTGGAVPIGKPVGLTRRHRSIGGMGARAAELSELGSYKAEWNRPKLD